MATVVQGQEPDVIVVIEDALTVVYNTGTAARVAFRQATPAATWNIPHNLNPQPTVTILVLNDLAVYEAVDADVEYPNANSVYITFASPTAGYAYLF